MTPLPWPLRIGYALACIGAAIPYSISGTGNPNPFEWIVSVGFAVVVVALVLARFVSRRLLDPILAVSVGLWVAAAVYVALEGSAGAAERTSLAFTFVGLAVIGFALRDAVRRSPA